MTIARVHPVHLMNVDCERRVAANPYIKPIDLGYESVENWQLPSTSTIAIRYYYSVHKLILILPFHGGWKAESS